ncbi:MAG: amidohydrolase [Bryobacteraceae bacterium]|nr:amidohydrolase [Bryobacteraceae bacterium]
MSAVAKKESPWGPLEVADAHLHFFSHGFFSLLAKQAGLADATAACARGGVEAPPEQPEMFAAQWAEELDRHGVSRAVLLASLPGDEESVARAVRAFPQRFWGWFFLNPAGAHAAARCEEWLGHGMRGVCLLPAMHGYPLSDARVEEVLQVAERHHAVVFVHCGVLSVGIRARIGVPSPFDMRFSNPIDVHALAVRHPRLRFVIPHFGGGYLREALMTASLCPNVYFDTSSSNSWVRYLTPPPTLEQVFAQALEILGPERLLFGTDSSFFPRGWVDSVYARQCEALKNVGATAEQARAIFGGNLRRLMETP